MDTVPENEAALEEVIDTAVDQAIEQSAEDQPAPVQEAPQEERVPLSALQKERRKRQEMEQELRWHKEQMMASRQPAPEPDETLYEAATKEDLGKAEQKIVRSVEERTWIRQNPDKVSDINEKLAEFLKQRPHLASAIENAPNRYEEAWELMDKLTPKQKAALRPAPPRRDAPGNPAAIPKAAAMNQSLDVMSMSDSEFNAWRNSHRKRR